MRLIDGDKLRNYVIPMSVGADNFLSVVPLINVDEQPTIDATEVIRCKDCVFFSQPKTISGRCDLRGDFIYTNDFCSYAVKENR